MIVIHTVAVYISVCDILLYCCVLITVTNQLDGASSALSPEGSLAGSLDQLHVTDAAEENEASLIVDDSLWQMTSDKQPLCSASLLSRAPSYDPHVAFTRLFTPVATSSALPYFAAMPPAAYHCDCDQRQAKYVNSRPVSESSPTYTMPVPSDAVLVRPRMPLVAGKHAECRETISSPPGMGTAVMLLSSTVHNAGSSHMDASSQETDSSAATVYGGGFCAPPAHTDEATAASFSCCPHCGVCFAAAAVPQNVFYHPTGPSYVIHSFSPALHPCYSVTVSSIVARPPSATYTAGVVQSSVRLPDGVYQQTSSRPPLPSHLPSASLSFISAPASLSAVRVRTARPPLSCANCGHIGHTQLDCKEPTIDTVLNTRE